MIDETPDAGAAKLLVPALAPVYNLLAPLGYAFIRVVMGLMFLPSGIDKVFLGGNERIAGGNLTALGLPNVAFWSWAVACTEIFRGRVDHSGIVHPFRGLLARLFAHGDHLRHSDQIRLPVVAAWFRSGLADVVDVRRHLLWRWRTLFSGPQDWP